MMAIFHETFTFAINLSVPPERAFAAYVDTALRATWSAPNPNTQISIIESDVCTGGSEVTKCGPMGGDLLYQLDISYHLVEQNKLISFTEVLREGRAKLTAALVTFEFRKRTDGTTDLHVADQVTSFVGNGGLEGHSEGYANALKNLAALFEEES
ncbi:MAG: SRPBCC domain-containing protein [Pseudomonadota bacterium]